MKCGIVGLPNVGKSTLFNCLSNAKAQSANYPFCTIEPNVGTVSVPDTRLNQLEAIVNPERVVPAVVEIVESAFGVRQIAGGALGTMVFGLILERTGQNLMSPIHFLIMGLIGSVFAQIGDLIASSFKRDCGVKDYPKLIPGHGGILDRFDSVLMAAVSVFLYLAIIFGQ